MLDRLARSSTDPETGRWRSHHSGVRPCFIPANFQFFSFREACALEPSTPGMASSRSKAQAAEGDASFRVLDAVWDVPIGLGLCDARLRFVRVNDALADFDGLPSAAHY